MIGYNEDMQVNEAIRLTYSALKSLIEPGKAAEKLPKAESKKYPEIYVFRHGQSKDNVNRIYSGWRDSELTALGKKQAKMLHEAISDKQIDVCITSRLSRSIETAQIALAGMKVKYEVDDRIIERDYGKLSGTSKLKDLKDNPVEAVKYRRFFDYPPPGGESMKMVKERVFEFCDELVKRVRDTGENVALSAHGNSMKMIRLYFEKLEISEVLEQENPLGQDYAEYVVEPKRVVVAKKADSGSSPE